LKLRDWYELVRIQLKREEGQTMAEYGLLIALIAVIVMGAVLILGNKLNDAFTQISNAI
jgi:pilus assembly protein Flp/PilA